MELEWIGDGKREKKKDEKNTENKAKITLNGAGEVGKNAVNSETEMNSQLGMQLRNSKKFFENRETHQNEISIENVRWLTSIEAAQYLRLSSSGLKTMVYRGQVRVHKLGRRNRFLREELERLITIPNQGSQFTLRRQK